jgi:hypothetical protein
VVVQAPEHIIEKKRSAGKKTVKGPAKGEISWSEETLEKLRSRPPETLRSRFRVTHGMILSLLQKDAEEDDPNARNFQSLRELIGRCHEEEGGKPRLIRQAAVLVRSLYRAGIVRMKRDSRTRYFWVVVAEDLQWDFSLNQALSLYLIETLPLLDAEGESYVFDLITLVEAILENPDVILWKQIDKAKGELVAQLKADGVPYEERMERLEEVTYPKPLSDFIYGTFNRFRGDHPWVGGEDIHPKSIGRELFEEFMSFADYVKRYGLQRSEGVLLRYLSQLYKTLDQNVPEPAKSEPVWDALGFFRALVETTDSSLFEEWEGLLHPEVLVRTKQREAAREVLWLQELLADSKTFAARVRAEMHLVVRALSQKDWEEAATLIHQDPDEPETLWDSERFEGALAPYFSEYGDIPFTPEARRHQWTQITKTGNRTWEVSQTLLDPQGDNLWAIQGRIDLSNPQEAEGPIVRVVEIGV